MITVTLEKKYGAATLRTKVTAPTVQRALEIARSSGGEHARFVFLASAWAPPDPGESFAGVPKPTEASGTHPAPAVA